AHPMGQLAQDILGLARALDQPIGDDLDLVGRHPGQLVDGAERAVAELVLLRLRVRTLCCARRLGRPAALAASASITSAETQDGHDALPVADPFARSFARGEARGALEASERLGDVLDGARRSLAGLRERRDLRLDALALLLEMVAQLREVGDQAVDLGDGRARHAPNEMGDVGLGGVALPVDLLMRGLPVDVLTRPLPDERPDVGFDFRDLSGLHGWTAAHDFTLAPASPRC